MAREIDGAVNVRAIIPSDAESYREVLQRMSAEDRYCRFFHMVDHFDEGAVERYVETRTDTIGLIAEKRGRPLGAAHAFFIDEGLAEIAIVVASDARHLGVGRRLFDRLIAALQQRRCMDIIGYALAQNGAMSNLARSVGMRPVSCANGIVTWTLSPAGIPAAERAHETRPELQTGAALLQPTLPAAPGFVIAYFSLRACKASVASMALLGGPLLGCRNLLMLAHELLATMLAVQRAAVSLAGSAPYQAGIIGYRYGQLPQK
jgi:GNAT superfamily N-acetyltransferase